MLVSVSNTSGLAGIAHWINTFYHLKGDFAIDKGHPLVSCIKELVDREYDGTDLLLIIFRQFRNHCGIHTVKRPFKLRILKYHRLKRRISRALPNPKQ